ARTVLVRGSSTGFIPPPRGAPRRASRRRTAAPPLVPGVEVGDGAVVAAGVAGSGEASGAGAAGGGPAGAGAVGAEPSGAGVAGADSAGPAAAVSCATSPLSPEAGRSCCPRGEVTSASALPVIVTSPATCAPVIRQGSILSAASRPHVALGPARRSGISRGCRRRQTTSSDRRFPDVTPPLPPTNDSSR